MWELENCSGKFPIRRIVMVFLRVRKIIMAWIQKTQKGKSLLQLDVSECVFFQVNVGRACSPDFH
jgi:hypothetical protein